MSEFAPIGPHFARGQTRIGRHRLPAGTVAHFGNDELLRLAIRDLHSYAIQKHVLKPAHVLAFRLIDERERDSINHKIREVFGANLFASRSAEFCPAVGFVHVMDNEHVAHVVNRHGEGSAEAELSNVPPVTLTDLERVPSIVRPRNIVNFVVKGVAPRIVYESAVGDAILTIVEELRQGRGVLAFKTAYAQRRRS